MVEFGVGEYYYQVGDIIEFLKNCPLGQLIYIQKSYGGSFTPVGVIDQTNVAVYLSPGSEHKTIRDLYNIVDPPQRVTDNARIFAHELKKSIWNIRGRYIPLHKSYRVLYIRIGDECYPVEKYDHVSNGFVLYAADCSLSYKNAEHFAEEFLKRSHV